MKIKKYNFNLAKSANVKELHAEFSEKLAFPEYYGANLDALYDALTDISETMVIEIYFPEVTQIDSEYLERVCQVFRAAEEDNTYLEIKIER